MEDEASWGRIFEKLESNVRSYCRSFPVVFDRAKGDLLYSEDGRAYIDFFAGAGALNYGHNNDYIKDRVLDYLTSDRIMHGLDMYTMAKREFIQSFGADPGAEEAELQASILRSNRDECGGSGPEARTQGEEEKWNIRIHGWLPRHVARQSVGDKLQVHERRGGASSGRSYVHAAPERGFRRNGYARLYREYPD